MSIIKSIIKKIRRYCQVEGEEPFDWNKTIDRLIKKYPNSERSLSDDDSDAYDDLSRRSGSWVTCACGNQCAALCRHEDGEPEDLELSDLGGNFHSAIVAEDWDTAKAILVKIEKRSTVLLRKMAKDMGLQYQ